MIRGVTKTAIPYVLEEDRVNKVDEQTIFHITPKTGHDNNKTMQRYAAAMKDGKKGGKEINVEKLTLADQEEFLSVVSKVENYIFPDDHELFQEGKPHKEITSQSQLKEVAATLAADHLTEILDVSNSISKLKEGAKKNSNS